MSRGQIQCAKKGKTHRTESAKAKCPYCSRADRRTMKNRLPKPIIADKQDTPRPFNKADLDNRVSSLQSKRGGGWDALISQIEDSPDSEVHIPGLGDISIVNPHIGFFERSGKDDFGNEPAEITVQVVSPGEPPRYFQRTGIENSMNGVCWEGTHDYRFDSENSRGWYPYSSDFQTKEGVLKKQEITVFEEIR